MALIMSSKLQDKQENTRMNNLTNVLSNYHQSYVIIMEQIIGKATKKNDGLEVG
jgi:hypothetical protein